jgi:hypothetical protein
VLLNSHISAYTRYLAEKVCSLLWSTWGTSLGEDKLGARDKICNTKVAWRACAGRAGQTFPHAQVGSEQLCGCAAIRTTRESFSLVGLQKPRAVGCVWWHSTE